MKEIKLSRNKVALVDDEDFEWITKHKYYCTCSGYAARAVWTGDRYITKYMHREIANTPTNLVCDHINLCRRDNQKHNLRNCTKGEDTKNTYTAGISGYKGVTKMGRGYFAQIWIERGYKYLGMFRTDVEAAIAYNNEANKKPDNFRVLNIIPERKEIEQTKTVECMT